MSERVYRRNTREGLKPSPTAFGPALVGRLGAVWREIRRRVPYTNLAAAIDPMAMNDITAVSRPMRGRRADRLCISTPSSDIDARHAVAPPKATIRFARAEGNTPIRMAQHYPDSIEAPSWLAH